MPLATLGVQVTPTGISAPSYAEILQSLQESIQGIYGADVYINADSQDGQFLAVLAASINDVNQGQIAAYNAMSPTFAQGVGLSSLVKLNGITRKVPTNSTSNGDVVGVAGTVITDGVVADTNGHLWNLPALVTIPGGGVISVQVTAQELGAITALTGDINKVNTPIVGWQTFSSTEDSTPGAPVETDAALRGRQRGAASLPTNTPLAGILAAVEALPGVTDVAVYENPSGSTDSNGIPARNIAVVIEGGIYTDIAQAIGQKKTPGAGTYGTVTESYTDPITGIVYAINFFILGYEPISVQLTVDSGVGWSDDVKDEVAQSIFDYVNALPIGTAVQISRIWSPAYLNGAPDGQTYSITALTINSAGINVPVAFNKAAAIDSLTDITITVV